MIELYKALIVILVLGGAAQWLAQRAFFAVEATAGRAKNTLPRPFWPIWLWVTLIAFFAHDAWIFLLATAAYLATLRKREPCVTGVFLAVILIVPPVYRELPTFGIVQHLLPIDLATVAGMILLGPGLVGRDTHFSATGKRWVMLYVAWLALLAFVSFNFTSFLRETTETVLAIALPFEGARRSFRKPEDLHRVLALFVTMCLTLSVLAIFEHVRSWLLYHALPEALSAPMGLGGYLDRGGELRAEVTTGQPIVLGYIVALGLVIALSEQLYRGRTAYRPAVLLILLGGLYASLSRGPWIGAAAGVFVFYLLGEHGLRRAANFVMGGAAFLAVSPFLPGGQKVLNLLPFVGSTNADTVSYRQDLFHAITPLLLDSPVFGIPNYDHIPQLQFLRQGEGIIDLVNTYIQVGVGSGLVGLFFFSMAHALLIKGMLTLVHKNTSATHSLNRAFLASYLAAMVILATTSSISYIPVVYWAFLGVGSALISFDQAAASELRRARRKLHERIGPGPGRALAQT